VPGEPGYFHVSSGDRNPLTFGVLYDSVRSYFDQHPFAAGDRGAARLPEWRFPGAQAVERLLATSERAHKAADYVIGHAPRSDRARDLARKLDQQGRRLEFLRRYLDIYHEYATAELRFADANTRGLFESLTPEDQANFAFDTAVIDWPYYFIDVHCPAVTGPIRQLDELRALRKRPAPGALKTLGTSSASSEVKVAAFFDMDGTLLSSNVIETYLWIRLRELDGGQRLAELGRVAARVPGLVQAERRQRSDFLRAVYREYAGARLESLDEIADEHLTSHVLSRLSPDAVRRIREHRAHGHLTVLITGAVRPLTRPLRPLFDHIEAADLATDSRGVCTGYLRSSPLVGESRSAWMRAWAAANGVDMKASFAYADSHSDLPLLEAVGNAVAVRPDVSLFRHARRAHWSIVDWASPSGSTRALDPAGGGR
jgi:HAD superfamily hydrolase (TIGR01490 family)